MNILFDFLPVALFFIVFKLYDIYAATAIAIVVAVLQNAYMYFRYKKIEKTPLITLAIMLVLGGATIFLHNEMFIKWKPTVVYWSFALVIIGMRIIKNSSLAKKMFSDKISLATEKWLVIDNSMLIFLSFLGSLNIFIAYSYDTNTWVNFKLFGALILTLVFCIAISCYMAKHSQSINSNENVSG